MTHGHLQAINLSVALLGCTAGCIELWPEPRTSTPQRVRGSAVASVSVLASSDSVEVGQVLIFNFELRPHRGESLPLWAYSVTVSWASSDTSVATVERNGYVLGKSVGVATISATVKGVVGTR